MFCKSVVDFEKEFRDRVLGIGRVLAMMGPWDDPAYLKRVWCIFECYTAIQNDIDVEIVMPPRERERMSRILLGSDRKKKSKRSSKTEKRQSSSLESLPESEESGGALLPEPKVPEPTLPRPASSTSSTRSMQSTSSTKSHSSSSASSGGVDALYKALANISVQNAKATVEVDRVRIMGILKKSKIGVDQVNKEVARYLRRWVRRAIDVIVQEQVDRMEQAANEQIAAQQREISKTELDDTAHQERLAEEAMSKYRLTHAAFCTNVAMLFRRNGEYNAASKCE